MSTGYKIDQKSINSNTSSSNIFEGMSVIKLGIQGPPGFQFSLNNGDLITLGKYGIYELDLMGIGYITNFTWKETSIGNHTVYVDYVYL